MQRGPIALGTAAAVVAAGGLYLYVAVHAGAPPVHVEGAVATITPRHAAPAPAVEPFVAPPAPVRAAPPPPPPEPSPPPLPALAEPAAPPPAETLAMITTSSGLQYQDDMVGTGPTPRKGQKCTVHYTGWLWVDGQKGAQVDSSRDRGLPITFDCGSGQVIAGWDEGIGTMRVGGRRTMVIPAKLGYGDKGGGPTIPPGATLRFDVELVGVE